MTASDTTGGHTHTLKKLGSWQLTETNAETILYISACWQGGWGEMH